MRAINLLEYFKAKNKEVKLEEFGKKFRIIDEKEARELLEYLINCGFLIEDRKNIFTPLSEKIDGILTSIKLGRTDKNEVVNEIDDFLNKFYNNENDKVTINSLRAKHLSKRVKFNGIITKVTKVIGEIYSTKWECIGCGTVSKIKGYKKPLKCSCYQDNFKLLSKEICDVQELEIEELQEEVEGKQPSKVRVRLYGKLTDDTFGGIIQPGNKVEIIGIVDKLEIITQDKEKKRYEYLVICEDITSLDDKFDDKISEEDMIKIREIASNNPLEKLSNSLSQDIIGLEEVKKALILQMASGVKKMRKAGLESRNRIHIFLCGEVSSGKTFLGRCVHLRMPKSYYMTGESAGRTGLSYSIEKDQFLNTYSLKAGALCMANDSILILDELDKFNPEDRKSLHTPMETGKIPVNRIIKTTLRAECSLLAIANPKDGIFNNKPIAEQLDLPQALLSRFDLIFVIKDKINEKIDKKIIMNLYELGESEEEVIPIDLFRKYITYAKSLKPIPDKSIAEEHANFYHKVRKMSLTSDGERGIPIGGRNGEGILRLAEASAKIRLSNKVELVDLKIAEDLFYNSIVALGLDDKGVVDYARIDGGKTFSKKTKMEFIINSLRELISNGIKSIKDLELKKILEEKGMKSYDYYDTIDSLNKEGIIIKKGDTWEFNLSTTHQ